MDYIIPQGSDGRSVLDVVRLELGISRSTLKTLKFTEGGILLNGKAVTVRGTVHAGDVLSLAVEDKHTPEKTVPCSVKVDISAL